MYILIEANCLHAWRVCAIEHNIVQATNARCNRLHTKGVRKILQSNRLWTAAVKFPPKLFMFNWKRNELLGWVFAILSTTTRHCYGLYSNGISKKIRYSIVIRHSFDVNMNDMNIRLECDGNISMQRWCTKRANVKSLKWIWHGFPIRNRLTWRKSFNSIR